MFKKFALVGLFSAITAVSSGAQLSSVGYDVDLKQGIARLDLGGGALDLGLGFLLDGRGKTDRGAKNNNFAFSVSGFYLHPLGESDKLAMKLAAGGIFNFPQNDDADKSLAAFVGLQPEITLLEKLIVTTRFGIKADIVPDFIMQSSGQGIGITGGASFRIKTN